MQLFTNQKLRKKQSVSLIIIALGVALFASAAFADLVSGSAYVDFKEALKQTVFMTDGFVWANHTVSTVAGFSLDGQALLRQEVVTRENKEQGLNESRTLHWSNGVEESNLRLEDGINGRLISKSSSEDFWRVIENYPVSVHLLSAGSFESVFENRMASVYRGYSFEAFSDPRYQDIERIVDAVIGNLANLLQVEPTADGGHHFYGTVIQAQLPPLVQALSGLAGSRVAYSYFETDRDNSLAYLRDMTIDQVSGEALQTPEGWLSKVMLTVRFHGLDNLGNSHYALLDLGYEIYDIGTTTVQLPNLSDQQVQVEQFNNWKLAANADQIPLLTERDYGHYMSVLGEYTELGWQKQMELHFEVFEADSQLECHYWEVVPDLSVFTPIDVTFRLPNLQASYGRSQDISILASDILGQEILLEGYLAGVYTPGMLELTLYDNRDLPLTNIIQGSTPWVRVFGE